MNKAIISKPVLIIPCNSLPQQALDSLVRERGGTPMMFFEETPFSDDRDSLPKVVDDYRSLHVVGVLAALPQYNYHHFRNNDLILALHSAPISSLRLRSYDSAKQEAARFYNNYLDSKKRR